MKKVLILIASALLVAAPAFAAPKKAAPAKENGIFVGGTLGFTFSNVGNGGNNQNGVSFSFAADGGYQINNRFGVGMQLGYSHGGAMLGGFDISDIKSLAATGIGTYMDVADNSINALTLAPYARINLFVGKVVDLFIEPGLSLSLAFLKGGAGAPIPSMGGGGGDDDDDDDGGLPIGGGGEDTNVFFGMGLMARPGVMFKLDNHFRLYAKLGGAGFQLGTMSTAGSNAAPSVLTRFGFDVTTANLLVGIQFKF